MGYQDKGNTLFSTSQVPVVDDADRKRRLESVRYGPWIYDNRGMGRKMETASDGMFISDD